MPELPAGGQDLPFGVPRPQGVLGLQRGDGMNRVRPADRLRARLGQPEEPHLAAFTRSAIAPTVSSIGTSGSTRCW